MILHPHGVDPKPPARDRRPATIGLRDPARVGSLARPFVQSIRRRIRSPDERARRVPRPVVRRRPRRTGPRGLGGRLVARPRRVLHRGPGLEIHDRDALLHRRRPDRVPADALEAPAHGRRVAGPARLAEEVERAVRLHRAQRGRLRWTTAHGAHEHRAFGDRVRAPLPARERQPRARARGPLDRPGRLRPRALDRARGRPAAALRPPALGQRARTAGVRGSVGRRELPLSYDCIARFDGEPRPAQDLERLRGPRRRGRLLARPLDPGGRPLPRAAPGLDDRDGRPEQRPRGRAPGARGRRSARRGAPPRRTDAAVPARRPDRSPGRQLLDRGGRQHAPFRPGLRRARLQAEQADAESGSARQLREVVPRGEPIRHLLARLLPSIARYRRGLAWGLACVALTDLLSLTQPQVLRFAVDDLYRGVTAEKLGRYALLLFGIAVAAGVFQFWMRQAVIGISRHVEYDLRNDLFAHLQKQPLQYFQHSRTGEIMSRATNDMAAVRMMLGPGLMYLVNTTVVAVVSIGFMLAISPRLTLYSLLPLPLVSLAVWIVGERIHRRFEDIQSHFATLSARVQESLSGVRVVRAFAREAEELEDFGELNREYLRKNLDLVSTSGFLNPALAFLSGLTALLALYLGGRQVVAGRITLGEFVAFTVYLAKLNWPMVALGWVVNLFQRGLASYRRILEILDTPPAIASPPS